MDLTCYAGIEVTTGRQKCAMSSQDFMKLPVKLSAEMQTSELQTGLSRISHAEVKVRSRQSLQHSQDLG